MRKFITKLAFVGFGLCMLAAPKVWARGQYFAYANKGGSKVTTSNQQSLTSVQRSFPGATVKVCVAGTSCSVSGGTLATLYSNSGGTALGNPMTAGSDGSFKFFTDSTTFDIVFYGPGVTTQCGTAGKLPCISAFTWTNQTFNGSAASLVVSILDFGAKCDGVTDDTVAIQAAINVAGAHTVVWPAATCVVTDTLSVSAQGTKIIGQGGRVSWVNFVPTSGGKAVFDVYGGLGIELGQIKITGLSFVSLNTTLQKTMIRARDVEEMEITDIFTSGGLWTGNTSIGLDIRGRQMVNIHDNTIFSQQPIRLRQNPGFPGLDCDHCHFWNNYLGPDGAGNWALMIDTDVVLTNFTVDGYNGWVKGAGAVQWNSTAGSASNNVSFVGIRHEQTECATCFAFDIGNAAANVNGLELRNDNFGAGGKGIKLRKVNAATIQNSLYVGTSVALDIDSSVSDLAWINSFAGDSPASVSITGQTRLFSGQVSGLASNSPLPSTVIFTASGGISLTLNGGKFWSTSGTLANNGQFNILGQTQNGSEKAFIVLVGATNKTTGAAEGGTVIVSFGTGGAAAIAGSTANFGVGNVGGKLTILWQNQSTVTLLNQLGASVDYTITVLWN